MGYIKARMIRHMAVITVSVICLTACGAVGSNYSDGENAVEKGSPVSEKVSEGNRMKGNDAHNVEEKESRKPDGLEEPRVMAGGADNASSNAYERIPVYGPEEKEAVRDYLAGLPDGFLSFQKAKKLGIIREGHVNADLKQEQKEFFGGQWLSFYSNAKQSKDILEGNMEKDIGTKYEDAVVIVCYTTEGDPIYKYISYSYRSGEFYLYEDASRDRFGSAGSREEGFYGSYNGIQWRILDGKGEEFTDFYLVKNGNLSKEKLEKMLDSDEGYDIRQVFPLYSMDYIADIIDGIAICR